MRRKDREITDRSELIAIIEKAAVCRLAMSVGDQPYIVPLSFGYRENALYFHGAVKGKKNSFIKQNPNVCFEVETIAEPVGEEDACSWSMRYQSVVGFGRATFINNLEEKRQALSIIMAHYSDQHFELPESKVNATAVIKVNIESMTGKGSEG